MSILFVEASRHASEAGIDRFDATTVYFMVKRPSFSGRGRFRKKLFSGFVEYVRFVRPALQVFA